MGVAMSAQIAHPQRMIQMDHDTGAEVLYRQHAGERRARVLDWGVSAYETTRFHHASRRRGGGAGRVTWIVDGAANPQPAFDLDACSFASHYF
jgi:hypothetical protein